jgi:hypothetical protein
LISRAKRDPDAHDALRAAVALQLFMEKQLPREATEWLVEFLLGRRERPTKSPGAPSGLGMEVLIYGAVGFLVEGGLTATRSDASEPVSACDAVAEAMNKLGKKPGSYSRVKAIYLKLRRMDDGTGRIPYKFGQ